MKTTLKSIILATAAALASSALACNPLDYDCEIDYNYNNIISPPSVLEQNERRQGERLDELLENSTQHDSCDIYAQGENPYCY